MQLSLLKLCSVWMWLEMLIKLLWIGNDDFSLMLWCMRWRRAPTVVHHCAVFALLCVTGNMLCVVYGCYLFFILNVSYRIWKCVYCETGSRGLRVCILKPDSSRSTGTLDQANANVSSRKNHLWWTYLILISQANLLKSSMSIKLANWLLNC